MSSQNTYLNETLPIEGYSGPVPWTPGAGVAQVMVSPVGLVTPSPWADYSGPVRGPGFTPANLFDATPATPVTPATAFNSLSTTLFYDPYQSDLSQTNTVLETPK
jgi:hypothetical protein